MVAGAGTAARTPCAGPGVALLAVAILAPPTLPWYLTWGLAIFGATPWRARWLALPAGLAVLILLVYYPNGEGAMGDLPHMVLVILAAILTGVSMAQAWPTRSACGANPEAHGNLEPIAAEETLAEWPLTAGRATAEEVPPSPEPAMSTRPGARSDSRPVIGRSASGSADRKPRSSAAVPSRCSAMACRAAAGSPPRMR